MDQDLEFLYNYEKYVDVLAYRKEIIQMSNEFKKKEELKVEAEKKVKEMKDNLGEFEV